jgi:transposase
MRASQKRYTTDFKAQAVKLVHESQKSVKQIADDLGVSDKSLYSWVSEAGGQSTPKRRQGLTLAEQEELKQLRKDTHVLRMERDLLKKSIAFFIKENTKSSR